MGPTAQGGCDDGQGCDRLPGAGDIGAMLLRPMSDGGLLCISQPAHALISGPLARAWDAAGLPVPTPLEPVVLACAQHDVAGFDPATGPPLEFRVVDVIVRSTCD